LKHGIRLLRGETSLAFLLLGLSLAAGLGFMHYARRIYPYGRTVAGFQRHAHWPRMWRRLAVNTWEILTPHTWVWFLLGALTIGLFLYVVPALRPQRVRVWRATLALLLGATAYFLFMGTQRWTYMNLCAFRFCHPVVFLLQGAVLIFALGPLAATVPERLRRGMTGVAAVCLLSAGVCAYPPSLRACQITLEDSVGRCTEDILAARCTHVAGNYWSVWPAVYHANLALGARHENRMIWGITGRSELTRRYWQQIPVEEWRIAVPVDPGPHVEATARHFCYPPVSQCGAYPALPGQAERALAYFHLPPFVVVEKRKTIWVLALRPPVEHYASE
jgi:hypothetical protein